MNSRCLVFISTCILFVLFSLNLSAQEQMMFGDTTRLGRPFSKDPQVLKFKGSYWMYYSIPPNQTYDGWGIGIAKSSDLHHWERVGDILPEASYEKKGLCAPGGIVRNDTIHLFYQTYGNGRNDAICHAYSTDGFHFVRNQTNPIFAPTGDWNCGRAIDAEVFFFKEQYFLYFATRTPDYEIQIQGVAIAPAHTSFNKQDWVQATDKPILEPEYPWEGKCVEGASIVQQGNRLYMFYAGAYNNAPQQVGVAISEDGIVWRKLSDKPFLPNGEEGSWNHSESGHPHIFKEPDNGRTYLFYQGNNDKGKTWLLSNVEVFWNNGRPFMKDCIVY